jgi:hypothetical protein
MEWNPIQKERGTFFFNTHEGAYHCHRRNQSLSTRAEPSLATYNTAKEKPKQNEELENENHPQVAYERLAKSKHVQPWSAGLHPKACFGSDRL